MVIQSLSDQVINNAIDCIKQMSLLKERLSLLPPSFADTDHDTPMYQRQFLYSCQGPYIPHPYWHHNGLFAQHAEVGDAGHDHEDKEKLKNEVPQRNPDTDQDTMYQRQSCYPGPGLNIPPPYYWQENGAVVHSHHEEEDYEQAQEEEEVEEEAVYVNEELMNGDLPQHSDSAGYHHTNGEEEQFLGDHQQQSVLPECPLNPSHNHQQDNVNLQQADYPESLHVPSPNHKPKELSEGVLRRPADALKKKVHFSDILCQYRSVNNSEEDHVHQEVDHVLVNGGEHGVGDGDHMTPVKTASYADMVSNGLNTIQYDPSSILTNGSRRHEDEFLLDLSNPWSPFEANTRDINDNIPSDNISKVDNSKGDKTLASKVEKSDLEPAPKIVVVRPKLVKNPFK